MVGWNMIVLEEVKINYVSQQLADNIHDIDETITYNMELYA